MMDYVGHSKWKRLSPKSLPKQEAKFTEMEIQCLKSHAKHGLQLAAGRGLKIRTIFSQRGEKGTGGEGRNLRGGSSIASHAWQALWASTSLNLHHWATITFLRRPVSTRGRVETGWGSVALAITTEWSVILMMGKRDEHICFQPQSCVHAHMHKQELMINDNHLPLYYYSKGYVSMPSFFLFLT